MRCERALIVSGMHRISLARAAVGAVVGLLHHTMRRLSEVVLGGEQGERIRRITEEIGDAEVRRICCGATSLWRVLSHHQIRRFKRLRRCMYDDCGTERIQ